LRQISQGSISQPSDGISGSGQRQNYSLGTPEYLNTKVGGGEPPTPKNLQSPQNYFFTKKNFELNFFSDSGSRSPPKIFRVPKNFRPKIFFAQNFHGLKVKVTQGHPPPKIFKVPKNIFQPKIFFAQSFFGFNVKVNQGHPKVAQGHISTLYSNGR